MKKITIKWKHFDKKGKTCIRCFQTGKNLIQAIKQIKQDFNFKDLDIELIEIKLSQNKMDESNQILINEVPIENLLNDAKTGKNYCNSCSDLIDNPAGCNCRTIIQEGLVHEEIPVYLIKQAIKKA